MMTVGRCPVHMVTSEPYSFVHSWNLYQGFCWGRSHLLPTKGMGDGPGGLFYQSQYSELPYCSTAPVALHCGLPTVFSNGEVDDEESDASKQHECA